MCSAFPEAWRQMDAILAEQLTDDPGRAHPAERRCAQIGVRAGMGALGLVAHDRALDAALAAWRKNSTAPGKAVASPIRSPYATP